MVTSLASLYAACLWPDSCSLCRAPEPLERITVRCDCGRQVCSSRSVLLSLDGCAAADAA